MPGADRMWTDQTFLLGVTRPAFEVDLFPFAYNEVLNVSEGVRERGDQKNSPLPRDIKRLIRKQGWSL